MPKGSAKKIKVSIEEWLMSKVNKTETCWLWTGAKIPKGYGVSGRGLVHRIMYKVKFGSIPIGMEVLHTCDVRLCVNPEHLFLGTDKTNHEDAVQKGRKKRDSVNGRYLKTLDKNYMLLDHSNVDQEILQDA